MATDPGTPPTLPPTVPQTPPPPPSETQARFAQAGAHRADIALDCYSNGVTVARASVNTPAFGVWDKVWWLSRSVYPTAAGGVDFFPGGDAGWYYAFVAYNGAMWGGGWIRYSDGTTGVPYVWWGPAPSGYQIGVYNWVYWELSRHWEYGYAVDDEVGFARRFFCPSR